MTENERTFAILVVLAMFLGLHLWGRSALRGKWCDGKGECISFGRDGYFEAKEVDKDDSEASLNYEVANVNPKQLYLVRRVEDGSLQRFPFGIFDVSGDRLIVRLAYRASSGRNAGEIRLPTDFSNDLVFYDRTKSFSIPSFLRAFLGSPSSSPSKS